MAFDLGAYFADRFGVHVVVLKREADICRFEKAVADFASDRNAAELMRSMMGLGIPAASIRWHLANPGESMMAVAA